MPTWRTSWRIYARFVELLALVLSVVVIDSPAHACINATISETEAVRKLKTAEAALDQGDVLTARALASDVQEARPLWIINDATADNTRIPNRAVRIEALSYVRDPHAGAADLDRAVAIFASHVESEHRMKAPDDPALLADYGEALERDGKNDEAYAMLKPLVERDLVGSAYALSAFARAAKTKHDDALAAATETRCLAMAPSPAPCRGEYPTPPFLRGEPLPFALTGMAFLALALVRLVRKSRPWDAWAARALGGVVLAYGAAVFALVNFRFATIAAVFTVGLVALLGILQRGSWFGAVQRGKVPAYTIRPRTWKEEESPVSTLYFMDQFETAAVLEHVGDAGYRESAKPVLAFHLVRYRMQLRWFIVGIAVLMVLAWFALYRSPGGLH